MQGECRKGVALASARYVHQRRRVRTLTNAKPIIIAAQTLKRCSINRKWLSPNFYFRLELRAIYHSERYEGGALGHAGRWYYSAITWGKMEDLCASKCVHVMAFPTRFSLNYNTRYTTANFFIVPSLFLSLWCPSLLIAHLTLSATVCDSKLYLSYAKVTCNVTLAWESDRVGSLLALNMRSPHDTQAPLPSRLTLR